MDREQVEAILEKLAPPAALKPVSLKTHKRLVLDDTVIDENTKGMFVNGLQEESQYAAMTVEKLATRFTQGLQLFDYENMTDVGHLAHWKASSSKPGNPIENALDDDPETFWQSDGSQPHQIEVYFSRRMSIVQLVLYFSLIADESYTPRFVSIYAGYSRSDALFYKSLEVRNVNGWVSLTFQDNRPHDKLLKCQYLKFVFPANHENGKDTHLRGIRVFAPSKKLSIGSTELIQCFGNGSKLMTEYSLR